MPFFITPLASAMAEVVGPLWQGPSEPARPSASYNDLKESFGQPAAEPPMAETTISASALERAMAMLLSEHTGNVGVVEVTALGERAIPPLRAVLLTREPSGLYESRRRAVDALRSLEAYDVLAEYLGHPLDVTDPIEQTGEEAVINAAARGIAEAADERYVPVLLALTTRAPLAGVVEALARLRRVDALPYFIEALADDFTRHAAEAAIRVLGPDTRPTLIATALSPRLPGAAETVSSKRLRRSALALVLEFGPVPPEHKAMLRGLMQDPLPDIAALACRIWLVDDNEEDTRLAIHRLVELSSVADCMLAEEIEETLVAHFELAKDAIDLALRRQDSSPGGTHLAALLRILRRANGDSFLQSGKARPHAQN